MAKGREISMMEIMDYIQKQKGWSTVDGDGEGALNYKDFKNFVVFDLDLTCDTRKLRELWKILNTSPVAKRYNKKRDVLIVEISEYNAFLSGMHAMADQRMKASG